MVQRSRWHCGYVEAALKRFASAEASTTVTNPPRVPEAVPQLSCQHPTDPPHPQGPSTSLSTPPPYSRAAQPPPAPQPLGTPSTALTAQHPTAKLTQALKLHVHSEAREHSTAQPGSRAAGNAERATLAAQ
ncbi:MAG: hypothetical protein QXX83_02685 [Thermofilum sp.]